MGKLIFLPFSIGSGVLAGLIGKKAFEAIWGAIDDEQAPKPEHRYVSFPKLIAALAIEGALFALIRGLVDHGSRRAFTRVTGSWPGEERPEPE
ncbi:MAG TPA: DUF4235 domain-containing protein [Solirubrobacteraceae bacterium]|jgi:hypothetical protein